MTKVCLLASVLGIGGWVCATAAEPEPLLPPVLLQMIRDSEIHRELAISELQQGRLLALLPEVDGDWWRSRILVDQERQIETDRTTARLRVLLATILDPDQVQRLTELERQALGTRMFLMADVAESLRLPDAKRSQLAGVFRQTDRVASDLLKKQQAGDITPEVVAKALEKRKAEERNGVLAMLTAEQRSRLTYLNGEPFDFSKIKRTLPLAPAFATEGATWIQGGPLQIEDLRGQVIAVHFYAFQCINCQRNFPHYQAWHSDYADQGLVVVGIQTPETSAEREIERVTAAMDKDGFEYAVVMDGESANWRAWGNTMWPTVYLIDKQGFIRRWWQGEMNWQGTPGERQMRDTIELLLAESEPQP